MDVGVSFLWSLSTNRRDASFARKKTLDQTIMDGLNNNLEINITGPNRGTFESLTQKVDRMMRDHNQEFDRSIAQYDQIIDKQHIAPDIRMKAINAKSRLLNNMSDNSTRIALVIERERRLSDSKQKTKAINLMAAVRLAETRRKIARSGQLDIDPSMANFPPKYMMYDVGAKIVATIGLQPCVFDEDLPEPD